MCTGGILFANIKRVVWLLNDDLGFGGYRKIKDAKVFNERFDVVEMNEQPYEDLKNRQKELMSKWAINPNNVTKLRNAIKWKFLIGLTWEVSRRSGYWYLTW